MKKLVCVGVGVLASVAVPVLAVVQNPVVWVRTGDPVPQNGGTFFDYLIPTMSPSGDVLFFASTNNGSRGLWRLPPSGPALVVYSIDGIPPPGEFYYNVDGQYALANDGSVMFHANRRGPGTTNTPGWYSWNQGSISPYVVNGGPAPVLPAGVAVQTVLRQDFSDGQGRMMWSAALTGTGIDSTNSRAVFLGRPGDTRLLMQAGQSAPGTATTFTFFDDFRVTESGRYAVNARVGGNVGGLWTGSDSTITPIAIVGGPAVGIPGRTYGGAVLSGASRNGAFGFYGVVNGENAAWVVDASDHVQLVGQPGQQLLNRPGMVIAGLQTVDVDDHGRAFCKGFSGSAPANYTDSLLLASAAGVTLIARRGEPAPGTDSLFDAFGTSRVSMNSLGQTVFLTSLISGSHPGSTIFSFTEENGLQRQLGAGDLLQLAPGVFKTVSSLFLASTNGTDAPACDALLDNGQYWFQARFTDGSVALMSANIPAPGGTCLGLTGLLVFGARRRRRGIGAAVGGRVVG